MIQLSRSNQHEHRDPLSSINLAQQDCLSPHRTFIVLHRLEAIPTPRIITATATPSQQRHPQRKELDKEDTYISPNPPISQPHSRREDYLEDHPYRSRGARSDPIPKPPYDCRG